MRVSPSLWVLVAALSMAAACRAGALAPAGPADPPPPAPSAAVIALFAEGGRLFAQGKVAESLEVARHAAAGARENMDFPGEALALRSCARLLVELKRDDEARAAWLGCAAAAERAGYGPGRLEAIGSAALLLPEAQDEEAAAQIRQAVALATAETTWPLGALQALFSTASEAYRRRRLALCRLLAEPAAALAAVRAPDSLRHAASLQGLGAVLFDQRELDKAAEAHRHSLAIRERLAPGSPAVADSETYLGLIGVELGELADATARFRKALAIHEKAAPEGPGVTSVVINLGLAEFRRGNLAAAAAYFHRSLAIAQKTAPGSPDIARALGNLGAVAASRGDQAGAREYLQEAHRLFARAEPASIDVAKILAGQASLALSFGDMDGARRYLARSTAIHEQISPDSVDLALNLNDEGMVHVMARQPGPAVGVLQRSLRLFERLAPGSPYVASVLGNLAAAEALRHDLPAALGYLRRARQLQHRLAPTSPDLARILGLSARLEWQRGNREEAARLAVAGWDTVRREAVRVTGEEPRLAFNAFGSGYLAGVIRCPIGVGKTADALRMVEEARAQALQQLFLERPLPPDAIRSEAWPRYLAAVRERDRAHQEASSASLKLGQARRALEDAEKPAAAEGRLAEAKVALDAAAAGLRDADGAYTRARSRTDQLWSEVRKANPGAVITVPSVAGLRRAVPPGALYAAFLVGTDESYLFLMPGGAGRLRAFTLKLPEAELRTAATEFLRSITSRRPDVSSRGRHLFARLFPGEAAGMVRGATRLILSPDGPLWNVPFAALVTNAAGPPQHLAAQHALVYTPSLTLYAQARRQPAQVRPGSRLTALVVGDARFERHPGSPGTSPVDRKPPASDRALLFPDGAVPAPLPGTREAARRIAALYGTTPLLGEAASEAAVRQQAETADVIHLATHGYLNPHRAMSSGVLLSAPSVETADGAADGALLAWEIQHQLKLRAKLVVLAACESGRGQMVRGEGVLGITRAFQCAGARSILASQWKVAEQPTMRLTLAFHQKLQDGFAKDEALRQSMLALRKDPATAHPFYWAAFYLIGDPANAGFGTRRKTPAAGTAPRK